MKTKTISHLDLCKIQIEEKLGWGKAENWASQDFEELSELILEATQEQISATTLKRVWGRVKYDSAPSTHTLNTLAVFLHFKNWRNFTQQQGDFDSVLEQGKRMDNQLVQSKTKRKIPLFPISLGIGLIAFALIWMAMKEQTSSSLEPSPPIIPPNITFHSNPVTKGVPNTVIFNYDLTKVKADSFAIQQSWDRRRRTKILPENNTHTSVYYYPGYYQAKLLANDSIIQQHDVYVESDGWLALIEKFPIPIYLPLKESTSNIKAAEEAPIHQFYKDSPESMLGISYYQVRDFGELQSDNFRLETRLRNTNTFPEGICHAVRLVVICSEGRIDIPFCELGCVGELGVRFGDTYIDGKTNDLSAFGGNITDWANIILEVKEDQFFVTKNGKDIFSNTFEQAPGKIVGLRYRFEGGGEIADVRLLDGDGTVVWEDGIFISNNF